MVTVVNLQQRPRVELIHHIGGDRSVLASMLVSTKAEASKKELDVASSDQNRQAAYGRIRFLMRNRHGTPFEHNQFCFLVSAPIAVFREFHRHRIGWSYNEESGRYKQLEPEFYVPGYDRPLVQEGKPGSYTFVKGTAEQQDQCWRELEASYRASYETYERLLKSGVAKEVARFCLPVGIYSSMYTTCNARSLMAFLSLRTEDDRATYPSTPMYEIQQVANRLEIEFATHMPLTYQAWCDFGRVAP